MHGADGFTWCTVTRDDPEDLTTLAALRSYDPCDPAPLRLLRDRIDLRAGTHTLNEGGFATLTDAFHWREVVPRRPGLERLPPADGIHAVTSRHRLIVSAHNSR